MTLAFINPMLPTLVEQPPDGDDWLHEIKYDGYRTQLVIDGDTVRAFTRNGYDWSDRYEPIVAAARALDCQSAIIDGEVCVQDARGVTDFAALPLAIGAEPQKLVLFAFDLLHLDGSDLRPLSLSDRRQGLEELIGDAVTSRLQFSPHLVGNGPAMFKAADEAGLEGVVSKRANSRYVSGRTRAWFKSKCFTVGEFSVLGVERSSTGAAVALLATLSDGAYAGDAMITLSAEERAAFWTAAELLASPRCRSSWMLRRPGAVWLKRGLTARVRHLRGGAMLRHATIQGVGVEG